MVEEEEFEQCIREGEEHQGPPLAFPFMRCKPNKTIQMMKEAPILINLFTSNQSVCPWIRVKYSRQGEHDSSWKSVTTHSQHSLSDWNY